MGRREAARPGSRRERDVTATITIVHRRVDGALVDGTAGGDGSALALKAHRFHWSRNLDCSDPR